LQTFAVWGKTMYGSPVTLYHYSAFPKKSKQTRVLKIQFIGTYSEDQQKVLKEAGVGHNIKSQ